MVCLFIDSDASLLLMCVRRALVPSGIVFKIDRRGRARSVEGAKICVICDCSL